MLRVNPEQKDTPLRGSDGLCSICKYGEVGLAVNLVNTVGQLGKFEGYTDSSASDKKLIPDVFKKGDLYYNSGDLLSLDSLGFFYWSDRVGDTFRWKGENVATTEVEAVLSTIPGIADVSVYGVQIPQCDGKAGMAAIQLQEGLSFDTMDWALFQSECVKHLPVYSRPVFIRIRPQMTITSTFKHQKGDLVKDSFNPSLVKTDELFVVLSAKDGKLSRIDSDVFTRITNGEIKL